jgi:hypothetical protein
MLSAKFLSYMGDLMEGAASVRGILVAGDFTPALLQQFEPRRTSG